MAQSATPWRNGAPLARGRSEVVVVIPMHNEAAVIAGVVRDVRRQFDRVVCVDDGSKDNSAQLAKMAGAHVVRHLTNLGQGAALETGIRYAVQALEAEYVVTFDADGQHNADDAMAMVSVAREQGLQAVLGSRFLGSSSNVPWVRRQVLRGAVHFTRHTTGLRVTDAHNGLRVLRRDAAEQLQLRLHGMAHASEILAQVARHGWSYAEHPVSITYTDYSQAKGQRGYNALNIVFDVMVDRLRAAT